MSLAEELLADLEEDGYDDGEPMIVQEEVSPEFHNSALIPKQTGRLNNKLKKIIYHKLGHISK